ncbi:MAG TPA: RNA polymerase sigma factor [Caulobacteraceae bacterium]|jgi:RNA polymerase sigma-70 factor (ECF subfamily)
MTAAHARSLEALDDLALAQCAAGRDADAVRLITTRNNQRLFRAAWSVLKNRAEAEEAVQEAYMKAFAAIGRFEGKSALSTWLTRIVINEALGRRRSAARRSQHLEKSGISDLEAYRMKLHAHPDGAPSPEAEASRAEVARLLEAAIARLPEIFRTVFVLREIEDLSVEETAEALGIPAATVKTRFLRARRRLQQELAPELKGALGETFAFAGANCERMTARVLKELGLD